MEYRRAVESGRRAAKVYEPDVVIKPQHKPLLLKFSAFVDDGLFALRLPHVLKVAAAVSITALVLLVISAFR